MFEFRMFFAVWGNNPRCQDRRRQAFARHAIWPCHATCSVTSYNSSLETPSSSARKFGEWENPLSSIIESVLGVRSLTLSPRSPEVVWRFLTLRSPRITDLTLKKAPWFQGSIDSRHFYVTGKDLFGCTFWSPKNGSELFFFAAKSTTDTGWFIWEGVMVFYWKPRTGTQSWATLQSPKDLSKHPDLLCVGGRAKGYFEESKKLKMSLVETQLVERDSLSCITILSQYSRFYYMPDGCRKWDLHRHGHNWCQLEQQDDDDDDDEFLKCKTTKSAPSAIAFRIFSTHFCKDAFWAHFSSQNW